MGNESTKERLTSMLKSGMYYMKNPQTSEIESPKESFLDSTNNSSVISSKNQTNSISDSFSYYRINTAINNSLITIDFSINDDLIVKFDKEQFKYSYFHFSNHTIVTLTEFIKKDNNYFDKMTIKNEKISMNNIICKKGICLIGFNKKITNNHNYSVKAISDKLLKDINKNHNMTDFNYLIKPEKIYLGSPIFYEFNDGKIYIIGIVNKINSTIRDPKKIKIGDIQIKFFTNEDILNLINMEYLFSHEDILLKKTKIINNIKRLNLSYEDININELKLVLQNISNIENLNLSNLCIDSFPLETFIQFKFKNLKVLNLSSNNIYNIPILAIANIPNLEELYIDNNNINQDGMRKFYQACQWQKTLKILSLNNNYKIRDSGFIGFNFFNLEKLYGKNIGITNYTVKLIVDNLKNLKELNLENNYVTTNILSTIDTSKIFKFTINFITDQSILNYNKSQTLKNNTINNNLIVFAQIFKNYRKKFKLKPYQKSIYKENDNNQKNVNNHNENNNHENNNNENKNNENNELLLDDIVSEESLLNEEYQRYCVNSIFVTFPDKSNDIFTSFAISSNTLLTLSSNVYNKEKGGEIQQILSTYTKQIMNPYIIFIKGKIAIICFTKNYFNEWFGVGVYNLLTKNIKNDNNNLQFNFLASLNYDDEKYISEIHSIKININKNNKNNPLIISKENKNKLTKCFGGPLITKINNKIYSIGLLCNNFEPYYFTKEDIKFINYNISLIKISRSIFTLFDIETKIINLELSNKEIYNIDLIKLLGLNLKNLKKIDISNNYIDERGCVAFSNKQLKNIKELNISNNLIGNSGFKILCENLTKELEKLNVSYNNITSQGTGYLSHSKFTYLIDLDISNNPIENKGILGILDGNLCHLKILNVSKCNINNDGINIINDILEIFPLENLNITANDISNNNDIIKNLKGKIKEIKIES